MKSFACLIYFAAGFSGPCAQHNDYIKRNFSPKNMANIFVPKCSSDGYYAEVQCRYGYCQCMQRDGQYIQGTRQEYAAAGEPDCGQKGGLTVRWQLCSNRVWGERSLVALGSESDSAPKLVISSTQIYPSKDHFKTVVTFPLNQKTDDVQQRSVTWPDGIAQIYQIAINWDSIDAACLQRLEIQTPHQRLRLIKDFTPEAKQSTLGAFSNTISKYSGGANKVLYFDKPCTNLPLVRSDYNITCLESYEWNIDNPYA